MCGASEESDLANRMTFVREMFRSKSFERNDETEFSSEGLPILYRHSTRRDAKFKTNAAWQAVFLVTANLVRAKGF